MNEKQILIDISNSLYAIHDDLWSSYQELKGLCDAAAVEIGPARVHIEQAMIEIDDKLDDS